MAKKQRRVMLNECPNCQSIWGPGSEEWDWQQCDSCGWPDNIAEDEDEFIFGDEEDFDTETENNNPNDSRNL